MKEWVNPTGNGYTVFELALSTFKSRVGRGCVPCKGRTEHTAEENRVFPRRKQRVRGVSMIPTSTRAVSCELNLIRPSLGYKVDKFYLARKKPRLLLVHGTRRATYWDPRQQYQWRRWAYRWDVGRLYVLGRQTLPDYTFKGCQEVEQQRRWQRRCVSCTTS